MGNESTTDPRLKNCMDRAAECDRATTARHPMARQTFVEAAKCWRELATAISQLKPQTLNRSLKKIAETKRDGGVGEAPVLPQRLDVASVQQERSE